MRRIALATIVLVAAGIFFVSWSQDEIIFPTHAVAPADPLPRCAERLELETPDGSVLRGVHISPAHAASGTLVLGFGGNAWNAENAAIFLHGIYPEADVVVFHYRGYRPSTGSPSAEALLADAPLVHDLAVKRVRPRRTIVVGLSIGSGVAANLATKRPLDALILVTPFDSLKAVAQSLYPWLPIGSLFRHEIDTAGAAATINIPVAIIAAGRDEIVAPARTDGLRERVRRLDYDRTIPGAGHNDIYSRPEFAQAMHEALAAVTG